MRLHYKGVYNLEPDSLPQRPHRPGGIPFKEAKDTRTLSIIGNVLGAVIIALLLVSAIFRGKSTFDTFQMILGCVLPMAVLLPHELLHAACFRKDVYLYTNLRQGMLFVVGPEDMSKARFLLMSLLPNIVFGLIPYAIGMAPPNMALSAFGGICTGMGAADSYNVFNTLTQVPTGAKIYASGFNSYWYLPK